MGIVAGMVGIEGIAVGMDGSRGRVTLGTVGMVGSVGFGNADGIWALGSGGSVVGTVGIVVGSGVGRVAWGTVGIAGSGGSVTLGMEGIVGNVGIVGIVGIVGFDWRRWRAPRLVWMVENDRTMIRDRTKVGLKAAIV